MGNTQPSPYTHPDQSKHGEDQLIQESQARGWRAGQGQARRAVGDLVMQPATPALVIAVRALTERRDVTITGHT